MLCVSVALLHFMSLSLIFLSAGYRRSTEVDSKPVTASLSLPNARLSDTSVDRVTIDSPRDGEREGSQEALHSPTTGQLKTVSVSRRGVGQERGGAGEGRCSAVCQVGSYSPMATTWYDAVSACMYLNV